MEPVDSRSFAWLGARVDRTLQSRNREGDAEALRSCFQVEEPCQSCPAIIVRIRPHLLGNCAPDTARQANPLLPLPGCHAYRLIGKFHVAFLSCAAGEA